jgi:hypothetical protein
MIIMAKGKDVKKDSLKQVGRKVFVEGDYTDIYIKIGQSKLSKNNQFKRMHSEVYDCEEYVWQGVLKEGKEVCFRRGDGSVVPNPYVYNQISGPGITLSGQEAISDFEVKNAIVCPVEGCDLVYNFIDEESKLIYIGKSQEHTLYIRIYDNNTGVNNDRWIVISVE